QPCSKTRHRLGWSTKANHTNAVKKIVQRDHQQAKNSNDTLWQVDQPGENDHRDADYPNHLEESDEAIVGIEGDPKLDDRDFEHNQPQPTRHQKPRQLLLALAPRPLKVSTRAREEYKNRRTEMRDPAREEQGHVGA